MGKDQRVCRYDCGSPWEGHVTLEGCHQAPPMLSKEIQDGGMGVWCIYKPVGRERVGEVGGEEEE